MFTMWWRRSETARPPSDSALTAPLALTDAPVFVAGDERCRVAWSPWTGAHRVGTAHDPVTDVRVVCWARLDNLDDLQADLGAGATLGRDSHPAEWLLAAYAKWGTDAPAHLRGDYSIAVSDPARDRLLTWRDAIGVRPLFFTEATGALAVSTTVTGLTEIPGVDSEINPEWLVHRSLGMGNHHNSTPYRRIHRVDPGHQVRASATTVHQNRYFSFEPGSTWSEQLDELWVTAMRASLDRAVLERLPQAGPVGSEATAGLDSSGIIATIAEAGAAGDRLHAFSQTTFSDPEHLIRATPARWGVQCTIDPAWLPGEFAASPQLVSQAAGYPHSHGMADLMVPIYRNCREAGIDTLFSGFGGDQCVSNDAARAILEWTDRGRWLGAATHVVRPGWKAPARVWRMRGQIAIAPELMTLTDLAMSTGFRPASLAAARVPELQQEYQRTFVARTVNGTIIDDAGVPLARRAGYWSRRAEECSVAAATFGIEYVWPLLDSLLMQQFLRTPTAEKYYQGTSRYLYRRVIAPRVPAEVAWRPAKVPGGPPRLTAAQAAADWEPPVRFSTLHPLLQELMDPAILACGLPNRPGDLGRMAQRRIQQTNRWLLDQSA